jgi:HSP20 family protein
MSKTTTPQTTRSISSQIRHHPLVTLRDEMDDLLCRLLGSGDDGWFGGRVSPLIDLSETDNAIEVALDLPGVNPEEVDIHLTGNTLTVRGERKQEKEEKERTYHRVERRKGSFARSVTLPCPVVEDEVAAEYKDGILTITLPKCQEARSRKINIKH